MQQLGKKIISLLFSVLLVISSVPIVFADENGITNTELQTIIEETVDWEKEHEGAKGKKLFATDFIGYAGKSTGDWYAIALGRLGRDEENFSYLALLKNDVANRYKTEDKLDAHKATEWHRISLAALSLGGDPTDFDGINLIKDGTYDREKTENLGSQGLNGYIWGLITLDSMRYTVPDDAHDNRKTIIKAILSGSCSDGGFSLDGKKSDIDITAMALQALAPYYNSEEIFTYENSDGEKHTETVRDAVDRAILWLSSMQNENGGFSAWGQENSESSSQVIIALCTLGKDPVNDSRFIKNGNNALDGLLNFRNKDGGFAHTFVSARIPDESNSMAGEQALCALVSLYRFRNNLRSLYDFRAEQSEELKSNISSLDKELESVPETYENARRMLDGYLEIPASERCYVYNYYNLSKALTDFGITYEQSVLSGLTGENTDGNGTVTDIFSLNNMSSGIVFNENDLNEYKNLPDSLTGEHYTVVVRLYEKLKNADNAEEYADVISDLEIKKEKVEAIRAEIESINKSVAENLYPFEDIGMSDKELIYELSEKADALSEYDRSQILGYEDLIRAKAQVDSTVRSIVIGAAATILVLACAVFFAVKIKKAKQNKKQENEWKENDEW